MMSRTQALKIARGRSIQKELEEKGVVVMAKQRGTLGEEMPQAYKDVSAVVAVVEGAGLSKRVARLKPIGVIKG